jgi:hypothetical protein
VRSFSGGTKASAAILNSDLDWIVGRRVSSGGSMQYRRALGTGCLAAPPSSGIFLMEAAPTTDADQP